MKARDVLRACIVCEWVSIVAGIASYYVLGRSLPEPLREWVAAETKREPSAPEAILIVLLVLGLVAIIVATVGLLFLQRWAAWLYLGATAGSTLLQPYTGPTVEHAVVEAIGEVGSVLSGLIIGLAFFTDALVRKPVGTGAIVVRAVPAGRSDA